VTRARVVLVSPGDNRAPTGDSESDRVVGPGYVGLAGRAPGFDGDERVGGRVFGPGRIGLAGENREGGNRGLFRSSGPPRRILRRFDPQATKTVAESRELVCADICSSSGVSGRPRLPHYPTEGQIDPAGTNPPP
jgi:hypothetical protein